MEGFIALLILINIVSRIFKFTRRRARKRSFNAAERQVMEINQKQFNDFSRETAEWGRKTAEWESKPIDEGGGNPSFGNSWNNNNNHF